MSILKIRKFTEKTYLPLFLTILLTFVSCSKESFNYEMNEKSRLKSTIIKLTSEEIFKGIFFLQGNVVNDIYYLKDAKSEWDKTFNLLSAAEKNLYNQFVENKIKEIKELDPYFFTYFGENVKSGNPLFVREALGKGVDLILNVLYKDPEILKLINLNLSEIDKINPLDVTNENGSINVEKLNKVIDDIKKSYENSNNVLSNFGMTGNQGVILCGVAAIGFVITVVAGLSYAVVMNVTFAVNVGVLVAFHYKVASTVDITGVSKGGSNGSGGNRGVCRHEFSDDNIKSANSSESPGKAYIYARECNMSKETLERDIIYSDIANEFSEL